MVAGAGGTRQAGLDVIATTLTEWGVPMTGVVLADGSGLSNDNRVTCQVFVDVLARSGPTDPLGAGLPVAGECGHADRTSSPTRQSPGGCGPRRARSATPPTTPTRRR